MTISFPTRLTLCTATLALLGTSVAAQELNLYTSREPGLVEPLLEAFTKETGVKVNTVFLKDGLAERVASEGEASPADLLMAVDAGNLADLVDKGLTQPVEIRSADRRRAGKPARSGQPVVRPVDARPRRLCGQGSGSGRHHL